MSLVPGGVLTLLFNNAALVLVIVVVTLFYLGTRNNDFFAKRGIKFVPPTPLLGNMSGAFFRKCTFAESYQKVYERFKDESVVGVFEFVKPTYMIRDTELIKGVAIKHFDSFVNHRSTIDHRADPIFGRNLFMMKNQRWKDMRTILSPAFTGSKMRFFFDLIRDCAKDATTYITEVSKGQPYRFEAKDLFTRLSNDVIATSAFGVQVNSMKDRENEFYKNGKILTNFGPLLSLKFFMMLNFPKVISTLRIPILDPGTSEFFRKIVLESMKHRAQSGSMRPDMIQLLVQTKEKLSSGAGKDGIQWEDDDYVAQSVLFFLAGFDATANLFSFMAYELALNPDVQKKLHEEIDGTISKLNGADASYEEINKLKYLDMVVEETLRKWPPSIMTDRACNKTVTLTDSKGQDFTIKEGESVVIPAYPIHRDPKFFPNPDKFIPERFADDNKDNIDQFAYQPFGIGPRQCIGNRFALLECKILFYFILAKFRINRTSETEDPLVLKKGVFQNVGQNGIWLSFSAKN